MYQLETRFARIISSTASSWVPLPRPHRVPRDLRFHLTVPRPHFLGDVRLEQLLTLHENNTAPQSPSSRVKPLEAFGACAEGGGDLDDIRKFVPAVTVIEEHDLGGVGRLTAEDEGSNLCLYVTIQHGHNAGSSG